ncbi:hypothetical protein [Pseudoalteromonas spongiae]|uniref:hypothetical protein n=1 Tax=Pseudoalteromonas spongiae TaxID=298657 RepID=UPI0012FE78B8|nr:hypothetical protein [Pseudoalteromonas spongiae]
MPSIRLLFALLCSFMLTACGGGGSLESPDGGGSANSYELKVTLHSTDGGNGISQVSAAQPGLLKATLTKNGKAYANQLIAFNLTEFDSGTVGTLDPEIGTAQTNSEGVAEITLRAGSIAGSGQVTAVYNPIDLDENLEVLLTFTSLGDGGDSGTVGDKVLTLQVVDKNGSSFTESNPVTKDNLGVVTATVTQDGVALTSGIVVFTTEYTGRILSETGTAALNSDGKASVQLSSGDLKGAGKVTATLDGEEVRQSAFYYSSGDDASEDTAEAAIDIKLLIDCNEDWATARDLVKLDPTDPSSGCTVITRDISSDKVATVFVSAVNSNTGDGFNGLLVNVDTTVGKLSPESGAAVTDNFGVALLTLQPGSKNEAGTITATAKNVSATKSFNVGLAEFTMSIDNGLDLKPGSSSEYQALASGATTVITVSLTNPDGTPLTLPLDVEFNSNCTQANSAELDSVVTSIGGKAEATYRSLGCNGNPEDTVTAVLNGKTISTTLPLSSSSVASIEFVNSTDSVIALKGSGGKNRSESSEISFKLKDELRQPVSNSRLDFKLSSYNGGVTLNRKSVDTNSEGIAFVTVTAGTVAMPLRVHACFVPTDQIPASYPEDDVTCWKEIYDRCQSNPSDSVCPSGNLSLVDLDSQISSVSDLLTITSGLPDNDSFTISAEKVNVEALEHNGELVNISVFMADHFNNPVPDGTSVHLRAEGGAIGSMDGEEFTPLQQCETVDGACVVQWRSQNPKPYTESVWGNKLSDLNPNTGERNCDLYFGNPAPCIYGLNRANDNTSNTPSDERGVPLGARATILATAVGNESFIDRNGNGVFDEGEFYPLYDLSEAFLDNNENGVFDGDVDCSEKDANGSYVNCTATTTNGGELEEFLANFDDSNDNGKWDPADGIYNGTSCSEAAEAAGKCNRSLVHLRRNLEIVMSGSSAFGRFAIPKDTLASHLNFTTEDGRNLNLGGIVATCQNVQYLQPNSSTSGVAWAYEEAQLHDFLLELEPSDPSLRVNRGTDDAPIWVEYCDVKSVDLSPRRIQVDDDNNADTPMECDGANATYDATAGVCMVRDLPLSIGISGLAPIFYYSDIYGNPLPAGTQITTESDNGDFSGTNSKVLQNTNSTFPDKVGVSVSREGTPNKKTSGFLKVTFVTPKGVTSEAHMTVNDAG